MKKKLQILLIVLILTSSLSLKGQSIKFKYNDSLNFTNSSNAKLIKALIGGLQCPQFSSCDLNNDTKKDLVIYDKLDGNIITLINKGGLGEVKYDIDMRYAQHFPKFNAGSWMLMRDYNQDGFEDIFTTSGVVYKNVSYTTPGIPSFEILPLLLFRNTSSTGSAIMFNPLNTPALHLPGIYDVDFDGDLDIMSYTNLGGAITYYKNEQKEMGLANDSMRFRQVDWCWGNFYDKNCNEFQLNIPNGNDTNICKFYSKRHTAGSAITLFDADNDRDIDMVIGNEGCSHLSFLINGKSDRNSKYDSIVSYDTMFVNTSGNRALVTLYPAAYFLDINNDGKRDLVFAPNSTSYVIQQTNQVFWYLNTGTDLAPIFTQKQLLFTPEIIDIGHRSSWAFNDWDKDGDLDALAASNGDAYFSRDTADKISLFENIGTNKNPILKLFSSDFGVFSNKSLKALTIGVADMNADGKLDIIAGNDRGEIKYLKNSSASNTTLAPTFVLSNNAFPGFNIDIGSYSSPCIADINKDGLLDLVIGRYDSMISYCQNIGTSSVPDFNPSLNGTNKFGQVKPTDSISYYDNVVKDINGDDSFDIDGNRIYNGYTIVYEKNLYTTPQVLDVNKDGKLELLVGNVLGQLKMYEIQSTNTTAKFKQIDSMNFISTFNGKNSFNIDFGNRISPAFADMDGNGVAEIIVSCSRGGVQYLKPTFSNKVNLNLPIVMRNISIFPNPAKNEATIEIDENITSFVLIGYDGKQINVSTNIVNDQLNINTTNLTSGIYFIRISTLNNIVYTTKLQILK